MHYLHKDLIFQGLITLLLVILLSIFFSFYTLSPLRNALLLTREFVKDILHDFNTPISTIRLNLSLIEEEFGKNKQINRIERSIDNVLLLQENLRNYVHSEKSDKEEFNLLALLRERVEMIERNYPQLSYSVHIEANILLYTHKKDFIRILDNLIGNASKYNKVNGSVIINYIAEKNILTIKDTGKGIEYPNKVFERFYKEHERGLGIGLHIVKKLCDELDIKIKIETILDKETSIILNIKQNKIIN
jgi:signal transduction histidine kinase